MDVKPGYKQTEVGVIPEDWEVVPITNATSSIFLGLTSRVDYVERGGVPLVRATDIAGGRLCFDSTRNISLTQHKKLTQYRQAHRGDVLVSKSGSLGVCALVDTDLDFSIYESIIVLQPRSRLHSGFLLSLLRAEATQSRMIGGKVGSTVSHLNLGMFRDLAIPLPPTKAEQEAITEALSDADALIESLEQLLAKKRLLKQGAMQELLTGKKRLPGFRGEWEVKRLGEIAHIKTGGRNNQDKVEEGEYPFFVRSVAVERINSYSYDCEAILIPGEGNIGNIFHYVHGRFDVHQRVYAITQFSPETSGWFVYFYMAEKFGAHAMQNSVKATVDSLRLPTFQNFEILMPPTAEEQSAIATILSDMDAEITALETKLAKARQIKQGMMQELLTGRVRLV